MRRERVIQRELTENNINSFAALKVPPMQFYKTTRSDDHGLTWCPKPRSVHLLGQHGAEANVVCRNLFGGVSLCAPLLQKELRGRTLMFVSRGT